MADDEHRGLRTIDADAPDAHILLASNLDAGRPVLTRSDPESTDTELRARLLATARALGRLVPQDTSGDLLVDIRDTKPADAERARGYQSNGSMLLHTDPSEVLAMLCLHSAAVGGATLLRQAQDVFQQLHRADPDGASVYFQDWRWTLPEGSRSDRHDNAAFVDCPILARDGDLVVGQYGSQLLRAGVSDDERQVRLTALDTFDIVANDPQRCTTLTLTRGECLWLNNYHTLHGRSDFVDSDRSRHLIRLWLWRREGPGHPAAFASLARAYGA